MSVRSLRLLVSSLLVAVFAATALAGDDPSAVRQEIEAALRGGGPERAAEVLDRILAERRDAARDVAAAKAAIELLPGPVAAPRAAQLIVPALRIHANARDVWDAARLLRLDVLRRVDGTTGEPFLRAVIAAYPDEPSYVRDLALLLMDLGRRADARAAFAAYAEKKPSDTQPHYRLALMDEEDGDTDAAVRAYTAIVERWPDELPAYVYRARVLAGRRSPDARAAIAAGLDAAQRADSESRRASFTDELTALGRWVDSREAGRAEIERMIGLQRSVIAAGLLVWVAFIVAGLRLTRQPAAAN